MAMRVALHLLRRHDLGLLEGLPLGDFQRLQGALALDAGLVDAPLRRHALALDIRPRRNLGALRLHVGLHDLHRFPRQGDLPLALGQVDRLAAIDLQLLLLALALDALPLDRQAERDLLALGMLAALQLGDFDARGGGRSRASGSPPR